MSPLLRHLRFEGERHRVAPASLQERRPEPTPPPRMVQRRHIAGPHWCFIDGCWRTATLVVASYPDDIQLCDDHRSLYVPQPWDRVVQR